MGLPPPKPPITPLTEIMAIAQVAEAAREIVKEMQAIRQELLAIRYQMEHLNCQLAGNAHREGACAQA
jgi:hypothetical protein